ncbi:MAG: PKD domain-containing protein [Fimbriimonadaceae bacterium]|nr:PKD domain-containing protein [Chitinophagales bacterium]
MNLEYSLDGGATWDIVDSGEGENSENWYNNIAYVFGYDPITFSYDSAWTGSSGTWIHAKHDITSLAGEPNVQLRFHFKTYGWNSGYDGIAVDNINIQDPYENDLEMTALSAPESMPSLTSTETIIVNVTNVGLNDQSVFSVFYEIDGGAAISEPYTGDPLSFGESVDIPFTITADFGTDGDYDVKIWTSLAIDEYHPNDTLYTVVSNLEPISGDAAYYLYSNIYGGSEPFFTNSNSAAMDSVFGSGEWTTEYFETLDPAVVFGTGTCFIFIDGGADMSEELETFLQSNETTVQNWVASGGHLTMTSAPYSGDGMDFLFGGVSLDYSWYTYNGEATDTEHPIFNYYFTPTGTSWTGTLGYASVSGGDIIPLIHDTYNPDRIILAEKEWGAGRVIFGGMTPSAYQLPAAEAFNMRASIFQYQATCTLADVDLGVLGITDPDDGCDLGLTTVSVKIANYGFLDQTDIPVKYQVDGGLVYTAFYEDTIASGDIADFTFLIPFPFTTGLHEIIAWTEMPGDLIVANDTADKAVNSYLTISSFPYYQDFETGASSWFTGGTSSTWELGDPESFVIIGAPDATPLSVNSWTTDLLGDYDYGEQSYIQGPCFDLTSLVLPYIEFDIWWATPDFWDGARLEYSLDGGASWDVVDYETGDDYENWYTGQCYSFGYDPITFTYDSAWVGSSGGWVHAMHDITALAGEPNVQFRFFFASTFFTGYDGVAIDNINIQDPYANDMAATSIEAPELASVDYTTTETVSVLIENLGTLPQDDFDVSYQVDGGAIVTEPYSGVTLNAGDEVLFTFITTTDAFTTDGIHNICAWTELESDEDISNDSTCNDVLNLSPISGTGAYLIYSNFSGWEPFYGYEYGSAMDDVFGSGSWTLDYFETIDPMDVFNEDNCFIYLNGGGDHGTELKSFLDNNLDLVQAWVESGGNLLLNASQYEIASMDLGFDGVEMTNYYYSYDVTAVDATHPVFVGPFTPVFTEYSGDFMGYGQLSGDYTLLFEEDFSGYDLLAEKSWGDGMVMFSQLYSPEYWYYAPEEGQNMHRNMIDYLKLCAPVDVGVTDLLSPESGCGLGSDETITIEITNFGPTSIENVPVNYQIDAFTPVSETYPGPLESGASDTYTFTTLGDFSGTGDHDLSVWTSFSGDGDETNDLFTSVITSLATPLVNLGPNVTICDEHIIDAGNPGSTYAWSTGATTQTIVVTETGTFSVTVTNPVTGCSATDALTVTVNYSPTGSFTYTAVGLSVTFTNTSTGGATYEWTFGDATTSSIANPSHSYDAAGSYTVTLTVSNSCGEDVYTTTVSVIDDAIEDTELANATQVYPNPTSGITVVDVNFANTHDVQFELVNILGETIWTLAPGVIQTGAYEIDMRSFADGVYQLKVTADDEQFTKQIVLTK